ncbi:MAG: hypothetical protein ACMUIL_00015 [bacterium]
MFSEKSIIKSGIIVFAFMAVLFLTAIPSLQAQYWTALPPYNLLWPLWSPVLSPVDATTGLATPLITSLSSATVLPIQPALVRHYWLDYPWLIYNTPVAAGGGLSVYDALWGFNPFPPPGLLGPLGTPLPAPLPLGFGALEITDPDEFSFLVNAGNLAYLAAFPTTGVPLTSLLTAADIWGPLLTLL